jgi:streptogramin lyase
MTGGDKVRFALAWVVLCIAAAGATGTARAGEFQAPFGYSLADGIFAQAMTAGPDGNLWFTGKGPSTGREVVGKVTPAGEVTEYPLPDAYPNGWGTDSIVSGPDGDLWFVEWAANAIGRVATDGRTTSYPLPQARSRPTAITVGPDGNLWFTEGAGSRIGRITTGGEIKEFALRPGSRPSGIVAGSDGNLWFTERGANRIGRITTSGRITEFHVPGPWAKLSGIAAGPEGNLWFTEGAFPRVGRITPQGRVTQYTVPTDIGTHSIVSGPGGRLWFASGHEVAAIDPSGRISWPACLVQYCRVGPAALAVGPDGGIWAASGIETCTICGGGSAIGLLLRPGGIGRYELPPVSLGIGPRAAPVRNGATSLTMACGLAGGCRGVLRLGFMEYRKRTKQFRVQAKGAYDLEQGEAKRVPVRVFRSAFEYLNEADDTNPFYVRAVAGPVGRIDAQRGPIVLALGSPTAKAGTRR